ncbi:GDSL-type esterase/lipase family protein [Microaceticoccus formicicus]|uniref:GDSL-type esterase/lipase family protein n=1 Tax=Microaceticoccus formicicus TaxID=3118105 RepID=UPI003CD046E4|nr:GDSL-type esterase/lipase family protein [Peptoniphilaceae bacterium AMB_02]
MKIVCLGDSLTYGYMLPRKEAWPNILENITDHRVINRGINGDTTAGMLSRFQADVVSENPSRLIIMGGTNDFFNGIGYINAALNIKTMIMQCKYYMIKPMVLIPVPVISVEPMLLMKAGQVNAQINKLRDELMGFKSMEDFILIDLNEKITELIDKNLAMEYYLDDIHLNSKGNELVADLVKSHLEGE